MSLQKMHGVWSNRWIFVLAATGSAVGLGNIWKFPYIVGENGGGAFVLVYLLCIALVGIPIMLAEVLLGRRGRQSPVNSMRYIVKEANQHKGWILIGIAGVVAGLCILSFYSIVASWILHYVVSMAKGTFDGLQAVQVSDYFGAVRGNHWVVAGLHTLFILMNVGVVALGVTRGLGLVARILMPLLFAMLLILLGYAIAKGDFAQALSFMFSFKLSDLTSDSILTALGHAFFTLSLGMGAIMAYGAYMPGKASIGQTVLLVGVLDTLVALVAGLAIFPIVFMSGIEASSGPGLLFVSLPVAFSGMTGGAFFGTLFFALVMLAAWSSAVSLIEPGVAWLVETKRFNRVQATVLLGGIGWLGGLGCLYSDSLFDFLDVLTSQFLLPLGGLCIAVFVGWFLPRKLVANEMNWEGHPMMEIWMFVLRYVSPVLVALIFVMAIFNKFFK